MQRKECGTIGERRRPLDTLVGEKLLNHLHGADSDPSREANVPKLAAEVRTPWGFRFCNLQIP
jgi:hypothetical protein